jgi:A/G-specific adenine glycosylase
MLDWFEDHQRDFPWRREGASNYEVLISEVLLQRTKAETVAKYYDVFFSRYPGWDSLAAASLQELEEMLKPLGLYKHRAKRLKKITEEYVQKQGDLPKNKDELQESNLSSLYLANAFALFVLKKRAPLLDVNLARVLSRFFSPREYKDVRHDKPMQELARQVVQVKNPIRLNWAIIDFAALVCKSKNPRCGACMLNRRCAYYAGN